MDFIGFIGLGNMGRPMASNLARKGRHLLVHDINPSAVDALCALGADAGNNLESIASRASVVFTMLPDSAAVESVVGGPNGLLAHASRGSVIVDITRGKEWIDSMEDSKILRQISESEYVTYSHIGTPITICAVTTSPGVISAVTRNESTIA